MVSSKTIKPNSSFFRETSKGEKSESFVLADKANKHIPKVFTLRPTDFGHFYRIRRCLKAPMVRIKS